MFEWPVEARPRVATAGLFPMRGRGFRQAYRAATHALHLYEYAGRLRLGDAEAAVSPGTLSLTPAGVTARYDLPRPGRHWCAHLALGRAGGETRAVPLQIHLGPRRLEAQVRFEHLARLHAAGDAAAASVAGQELMLFAATFAAAAEPADRDAVAEVERIIRRELHRPLRVGEIAERVGLSRNYLARRFRRAHGVTIPRYLLARRIEVAVLLLTTSDLPIKQVAQRVGLPDAQHFNKQCRLITGRSPSAIRRGN